MQYFLDYKAYLCVKHSVAVPAPANDVLEANSEIPTSRGARRGGQGGALAPPWKLGCQEFFTFKFAK